MDLSLLTFFFLPSCWDQIRQQQRTNLIYFCVLHLPFLPFLFQIAKKTALRWREGKRKKRMKMLSVQGCVCYLHVWGAPGWGRAGFVSACENWGLGMFFFPYCEDYSLALQRPQLFLSGWQNYPTSLGRRLGTRNLFHSVLPVLPPLVPLAPVQAPEQASAFLLLCHPTVPSRSRRHCGMQAASWVTGMLP